LLFYFAIIAFVLSSTSEMDPKLTIVIATLGRIYVTIRTGDVAVPGICFAVSVLPRQLLICAQPVTPGFTQCWQLTVGHVRIELVLGLGLQRLRARTNKR
jgi:hypothetical protein